ncbi:mitochondrial import protein Pam17 [Cutaneotrichosporon oleaginosum]|uniref:Presequence translocated-associated motor subunit PAM17 n=1 Tax=Cutaneotrichosporon oleaginosum TaxID=879819 RepID=A0A0J0XCK7_9TREE|nr:mitochondrial import protein Pam17 [Cutaneotrichosporon oleaginosum]KLT38796.1 mitochondrial import protein Pam17 [Cutaneotrichosporon oleaginosum]
MTWSEYLAMRKRRRQWSTLTTIPTSIGGLMAGASYCAQHSMTAEGATIFGLDPMIMYGAGTVGAMALGYLVGPAIGNTVFSLTHPKLSKGNPSPLEVMDREFFTRIKERRADPSRQSVNNPAPDYYGEKIVSLQAYRRWLKDQKAYERKVAHGVPEDE